MDSLGHEYFSDIEAVPTIWQGIETRTQHIIVQMRKQHAPQGHDASTVEATPGRVGKGEHDQSRRGNSAQRGGPHREKQLESWPNNHSSSSQSTFPTPSYVVCTGMQVRYSSTNELRINQNRYRIVQGFSRAGRRPEGGKKLTAHAGPGLNILRARGLG